MNAVLNAALPIFALIAAGLACARAGLFDRAATDHLNRFVIYLALPALLFGAIAKITPADGAHGGFLAALTGGIVVAFAAGFALARRRNGSVADASIEGLDAGYSNVGFMGIPLCMLAFGPDSLPAAVISTVLTGCVLFLFAVALIEVDVGEGVSRGETVRTVGLALLRNPLFLSPVAGLCVGLSGFVLPLPIERFTTLLGGAASPVALVCIGLFLGQERLMGGDLRSIAVLVFLKLIVQPGVTAILAFHVFGMPPLWARTAVLVSALPIGSGPFVIAKLYRLDAAKTSGAILASHVFSVLTVSLLVAWLT